jgi:TonB family protein
MLAGSLLVHVLALLAVWLLRPVPPEDNQTTSPDEVAMVFESQGSTTASTQSPTPTEKASTPRGDQQASVVQPEPDTTPPPAPPPPQPAPAIPPPPAPQPPAQLPPEPAQEAPPQPTPPPPPNQQASTSPPTVSLEDGDQPALPPPPSFVMPQPPLPLPPLPRPARPPPPRLYARPSPQNPLSTPQDWSMNAAPSSRAPSRSSRGFDTSMPGLGGQTDSVMSYVAGAHPSGDWIGALKRWVQAHTYYPEGAIDSQQQGAVTVVFQVDRSGRVLSSSLTRSSRSAFLDMGFLGEFRNATVPSFTPDMTDPTTTVAFTMNYILVSRR